MTAMTMTATMKAVRIHAFGGPEVLAYEDAPRPEPAIDQVLVRVHVASVNPVDWKIRQGLLGAFPLPQTMGSDFSGMVESVSPEVQEFQPGDLVFGVVADESGSYAEYTVAPVSRIVKKPEALDEVHAAALPIAALTAWQALFDTAQLRAGQRVLIHAAAGGVGSFAVQLARWKGAQVFGTASARNEDYVQGLGANQFIDYHTTRFEDVVQGADVVLDTLGGDTQDRSWKVMKPGGILVSLVQPPCPEAAAAHKVRGVYISSKPRGEQLAEIARLVANGTVKVSVEAVLPLHEARKAQEMSQSGHARGKIVLVTEAYSATLAL